MTPAPKIYQIGGQHPDDTEAIVIQSGPVGDVILSFRRNDGSEVGLILPPYMRAWADMTAGAFNAHMADGAAGRMG